MSIYGISLVFSRIWTESDIMAKYGKIRIRFCPYMGKYGSEEVRILVYFTQCDGMYNIKIPRKNKSLSLFHINPRSLIKNFEDRQHIFSCTKKIVT